MQEQCYDYSEDARNCGCCIQCDYAELGCLCFDCKCKKCYWYSSPEEYNGENGHCDKTMSKEEWKEYYEEQGQIRIENYKKKKIELNKKEEERNKKVEQFNKDITFKQGEEKDGRCGDELQEL
jgi:hypothetical protein